MKRIAVREVDRVVGKCERAHVAHERIMISRNEIKSNSAREAKIAEEIEFNFCIALEARMVQFGSVAVHNHAIELCNDRLKRTRAAWR